MGERLGEASPNCRFHATNRPNMDSDPNHLIKSSFFSLKSMSHSCCSISQVSHLRMSRGPIPLISLSPSVPGSAAVQPHQVCEYGLLQRRKQSSWAVRFGGLRRRNKRSKTMPNMTISPKLKEHALDQSCFIGPLFFWLVDCGNSRRVIAKMPIKGLDAMAPFCRGRQSAPHTLFDPPPPTFLQARTLALDKGILMNKHSNACRSFRQPTRLWCVSLKHFRHDKTS